MTFARRARATNPDQGGTKNKKVGVHTSDRSNNEIASAPKRATESHTGKKTLKDLHTGDTAQIVDFFNHDDTAKKIEAMGLRKGKRITVLKKLGRGILVKAGGTRIAITTDVAKNIEVK